MAETPVPGAPSGPRWIDNHCHLTSASEDEQLAEAFGAGVIAVVDVGTDLASSREAIERANRQSGVWATVGLHPHDARDGMEGIAELLGSRRVVAVGECGLDYHYDHSPRDVQRRVFAEQILLAKEHSLALVIHTREAWDDTFAILAAEGAPARTVMHCFSGGPDEARRCLDLGAYLSFSGVVSFPNAVELREAAALCPADRLLVETDSPYLAPVPHRGKKNRPALLPAVGAALSAARGEGLEAVATATVSNAVTVYGLPAELLG